MLVIAHLSDLHFGPFLDENVKKALRTDILTEITEKPPDFIVVTGDLSEAGEVDQLKTAKAFLLELKKELRDRYNKTTHLIVIPGNHDEGFGRSIKPFLSRMFYFWRAKLEEFNTVFGDFCGEARAFGAGLMYDERDPQGNIIEENFRRNNEALKVCEFFPALGITFFKFDSTLPYYHFAWGKIGSEQFTRFQEIKNEYRNKFGVSFERSIKVALLHHHVFYMPSVERDIFLLCEDAGDFWKQMIEAKVDLVLHGHKHVSTVVGITYRTHLLENREIAIVPAGSATSKDITREGYNSYNLITIDDFKLTIDKRGKRGADPFRSLETEPITRTFLIDQNRDIRQAFFNALVHRDRLKDEDHKYTELTYSYNIKDRDIYTEFEYKGVNVRLDRKDSDHIKFLAAGDSLHPQADLPEVTDKKNNRKIQPIPILQLGKIVIFKLPFHQKLPLGNDFYINVKYKWPNCIVKPSEYIFCSAIPFINGVDLLKGSIKFDRKPSNIRFNTIDEKLDILNLANQSFDLQEDPTDKTFDLTYKMVEPNLTYIITFDLGTV